MSTAGYALRVAGLKSAAAMIADYHAAQILDAHFNAPAAGWALLNEIRGTQHGAHLLREPADGHGTNRDRKLILTREIGSVSTSLLADFYE